MIKLVLSGLWICIITLVSSYGAVLWKTQGAIASTEGEGLKGLNYTKTPTINVPIIVAGAVEGYVVAQFVYTADASALKRMSVPPDSFMLDEAFRTIFADERIEIDRLQRFDVASLTAKLKEAANTRFGMDLVQDVLVEQFTYVTKDEIRAQAGATGPVPVVTPDNGPPDSEGDHDAEAPAAH